MGLRKAAVTHSINQRQLALSVDIGGTSIKAGLIRRDGTLLAIGRQATPAKAPPDTVINQALALCHRLRAENAIELAEIDGVGFSIAGFVTAEGVVTATAHLSQEWVGFDLRARLLQELETDYYFALDTPAPTLGEAYYGAGRGVENFAYVTVSTGIGAGIISDGKYFTGGMGWAGGVGHTIIDETSPRVCEGCGNHGCLETFAATQGILATTAEVLDMYPDSLILSLAEDQPDRVTPEIVHRAAQQGDRAALEVWQHVGHILGIGLVNLVNIVSVPLIVIGGGISQAGNLLLEPARRVLRERAFPPQHRKAQIVQAELGDLSGIYGAAAMVFHDIRINLSEELL
jgi:glucokinase